MNVFQGLVDLLQTGGPVVGILLAMSVLALAIVVLKLVQFRSVRVTERSFVRRALAQFHAGRTRGALALLEGSPNPIARVLEVPIRAHSLPDAPRDVVREEIVRVASDELDSLRSYVRPLEVIAALSPLLGLLGTVLGMIDTFQQMEQAGGRADPSVLSGGIWEALLTTAVGLSVAIPAVAAISWMEATVERVARDMEGAVTQVFTAVLRHAPKDRDESTDLSTTEPQLAK